MEEPESGESEGWTGEGERESRKDKRWKDEKGREKGRGRGKEREGGEEKRRGAEVEMSFPPSVPADGYGRFKMRSCSLAVTAMSLRPVVDHRLFSWRP